MNEIRNNLASNKPRSRKLNSRVDLTAMVSVSFLLIVFFMVSAELSKPKAISLGLPDIGGCNRGIIYCGPTNYRTITLLLDENDKIISYMGFLEMPEQSPKVLNYGRDGIRKELINKNKMFKEIYSNHKGAIVIIKPSKKSNYGNLIAILDEMAIAEIGTYTIINDFTPAESTLLAAN